MSQWVVALENGIQARADFIRVELEVGIAFADVALSAHDERKRNRNTKKAYAAYVAILRFMPQVVLPDASAFIHDFENFQRKLIALGEMGEDVLGRRLDDRIRRLSTMADLVPQSSPMHQRITERIKSELCEYFEREKKPQYGADRRRPKSDPKMRIEPSRKHRSSS